MSRPKVGSGSINQLNLIRGNMLLFNICYTLWVNNFYRGIWGALAPSAPSCVRPWDQLTDRQTKLLSSDSLRGSRIFCLVNNARFRRFSDGQILRNLNTTTSIGQAVKTFGTEFENFTVRGRFFWEQLSKIPQQISTSCDFRPPQLHNDYRSPETHY